MQRFGDDFDLAVSGALVDRVLVRLAEVVVHVRTQQLAPSPNSSTMALHQIVDSVA
ncbi:MAG: hypothetical protein R2705_16345 [Ilumatobacteraceae bacterium]